MQLEIYEQSLSIDLGIFQLLTIGICSKGVACKGDGIYSAVGNSSLACSPSDQETLNAEAAMTVAATLWVAQIGRFRWDQYQGYDGSSAAGRRGSTLYTAGLNRATNGFPYHVGGKMLPVGSALFQHGQVVARLRTAYTG